jgi:hypothetical protein
MRSAYPIGFLLPTASRSGIVHASGTTTRVKEGSMHRRETRSGLFGGVAVAMAASLVLAACSSSTATWPGSTGSATAAPASAATLAPATTAPVETATPAATETPAATATPVATATASPTPGASPTSPAAACTGKPANKAFIAEAAAKLAFDVYCAVLPSAWWVQSGKYTLPDGGYLELEYKRSSTTYLRIQQGNICPSICAVAGIYIGPAAFGDRTGNLSSLGPTFILTVGPGGDPDYLMIGTGMTQAQFTAWAAGLKKVP